MDNPQLRLEHIKVPNPSSQYPLKNFLPCAIIDAKRTDKETIVFEGNNFIRTKKFQLLSVFLRENLLKKNLN